MKILLLTTILHGLVPANHVELKSPSLPVGRWGHWSHCHAHTVARGFRLKVNFPWMNFFDNKGLTGIQLLCGNSSLVNYANAPRSSYSLQQSDWQDVKMCPKGSYLTSFNLRLDKNHGFFHDGSGATNLKMMCSDGSILSGDGIDTDGNYTGWLHCPKGQGINGLKTKLETAAFFDSFGLVSVRMSCHKLAQPDFEEFPLANITRPTKIERTFSVSGGITLYHRRTARPLDIKLKPKNDTNNSTTPLIAIRKSIQNLLNETLPFAEKKIVSVNGSKNETIMQTITSYKDPYMNFPVLFEVLILIVAGIFFFLAGVLFRKIYLVKYQEKPSNWSANLNAEKIQPVKFTDVKVSK